MLLKKFTIPLSWEERKPMLHDGVFIVPKHFDAHGFTESFLPTDKKIVIEYCSGNGDWIIHKAKEHPEIFWVAVDVRIDRIQKIWIKLHKEQIPNLLIVFGEALTFTTHYLAPDSIDEIYVNFPDPFPKRRHEKHRLIQTPFAEQLTRIVKKGGKATFATDHEVYSSQIIDVMRAAHWESAFPPPFYVNSWFNYGNSWFENLWKQKGCNFYYMRFIK